MKFSNLKHFSLFLALVCTPAFAATNQSSKKTSELSHGGVFPPANGKILALQGRIENGHYHASKNVFSCQAYDFGQSTYLAQDVLMEEAACVGFYNTQGDFIKAEIFFLPSLEKENLDKRAFKDIFESFGIGILKEVDNAEGIEYLREEITEDNMFFSAISIKKMSVLKTSSGESMASTRDYLLFKDKDKLVMLSNQKVTLPGQKHIPEKHIEKLRREIFEFKTTFKFGPIPAIENDEKALNS